MIDKAVIALQGIYQQVDSLVQILHGADPANDVCNLAMCKGDYIMPTLNGWLLGYPVVYLVQEANVQQTADYLSSEGVQRHVVVSASASLKVRLYPTPVIPRERKLAGLYSQSKLPCPVRIPLECQYMCIRPHSTSCGDS